MRRDNLNYAEETEADSEAEPMSCGALKALAQQISEENNFDRAATIAALVPLVSADLELMAQAIWFGCDSAARYAASRTRRDSWEPETPGPTPTPGPAAKIFTDDSVVQISNSNLMAFILPVTQLPLFKATKGDVEEAAHFYLSRAASFAAKHRWLKAVAEGMKSGEKVLQVYDNKSLSELRKKVGDHE